MCQQCLDVINQRRTGVNGGDGLAQGDQLLRIEQRLCLFDQVPAIGTDQHRALGSGIGITQRDAHQESIELGVG